MKVSMTLYQKNNINYSNNHKKQTSNHYVNESSNFVSLYDTKGLNFKGRTNFFTLTDIHQYADRHCKLVNKVLEASLGNKKVVLIDNGDLFKGIYPKESLMNTYVEAKKANPDLEIIFNVGNNDPGYDSNDRNLFKKFIKNMNNAGIHVLSSNIFEKSTGKRPVGIKPFTVIERDNDKLMYVGFSVNTFGKEVSGMHSKDAVEMLEEMAPTLRNTIKKENVKGVVFLVHDEPDVIAKLKNKAKDIGLPVEVAIGGHVHYPYADVKNNIYMPAPFGESMTAFDVYINNREISKLENLRNINSKNLELGIFEDKINRVNKQEDYYTHIAKSVKKLDFIWDDVHLLKPSELGTFYADGIKNISDSEIGIVPKAWIYEAFPYKPNDSVNKMDILTSLSQPIKPIYQIKVTPDELKSIYQDQMNLKTRLLESSQNVSIGINDKKIHQIIINGEPLFDKNGKAINPERKIVAAIDYFTVKDMDIDKKELPQTMYDGVVENFKKIENIYKSDDKYPTSGLII